MMFGNYGDWPDDMDYPINAGSIFSSVVEQEALNDWIKDRVKSIEEKLKDSPIFETTPEFEELRGELRALSSRGFLFSFRYFYECFCFFKDETMLEFVKRYFSLFNDYEKQEISYRKETCIYSQPFNPKFRAFFDFLSHCNCFAAFINCVSEDLDNDYYQGIKKAVYDTVKAYTTLFNRTLDYNEAHFAIDNELYQPKDTKENRYVEGWSCYVQYPSTIHEFIQEDSWKIEEEIEKREIDTFIDDTGYWDLVYEMYDKYIDEEWSGSNSEDSNTEIDWITPPERKKSLVNIYNYYDYGEYIYETLRDYFICSGQIDNTKVKQLSLIEKCSSYIRSLPHAKGYFSSITDLLNGTNVREDTDHKKGLFLLFNNQLLQIIRILSLYLSSYSVFPEILQGFCGAIALEKEHDAPLFLYS